MDDERTRTSLLIDADNISVEVVAEVLRLIGDGSRRLVHRRAYGSLEKAREFGALCEQHAIRFFSTTFAGTNGTDVALAIDAIELARDEPGDEFVLVTSDCDFLPLAARLRELGFYVCGFGQQGKSARDVAEYQRVYDEFKVVAAPAARQRSAARKTASRAAPGAIAEQRMPVAANESPAPAKPPPRPKVAILRPPDEDEVRRILEAVPALLEGQKVELSHAATLLRDKQLLAKNRSSTQLFKKYPQQFELTPEQQPNKVQYRAR
ncbi:MAG TPA: NYN domain-containing protein [Methylibium sp.]|uniref:NYN domain-containing protein n=1 Tax=Methylibium sp. TaxID=2067992 RepID=UPI002DBD2790|nr:NYN domain-containing protein [Methylibium sp.]HEU4460577.1 NYN domain-containing protein [Methylibium sp.]